jgi:tetratricopeptide (TPR) repeat protein
LGATGPIAVPLALAGGALAGAGGEAAVKNAVRGIGSIVGNVAKGAESAIENTAKGITGVLDVFKNDEDFFKRGVEALQNGQYKEAVEDFTQTININPKYADAYFLRGCIHSDTGNYQEAIADYPDRF